MSDPFAWVAPGAFGLSVLSLVFQGVGRLRGRARIRVAIEGSNGVEGEYDDAQGRDVPRNWAELRVIVENPGSVPLSIYDVGLFHSVTDDNERSAVVVSLRNVENSWSWTPQEGSKQHEDKWSGPKLPAEIPALGVLEWKIKDPTTRGYGDDFSWQGYAERYRAGRSPRRALSKERSSRIEP